MSIWQVVADSAKSFDKFVIKNFTQRRARRKGEPVVVNTLAYNGKPIFKPAAKQVQPDADNVKEEDTELEAKLAAEKKSKAKQISPEAPKPAAPIIQERPALPAAPRPTAAELRAMYRVSSRRNVNITPKRPRIGR